jgi:hypothetical protein
MKREPETLFEDSIKRLKDLMFFKEYMGAATTDDTIDYDLLFGAIEDQMEDTKTDAILSLEHPLYPCIFKDRGIDDCKDFRGKLASHCRTHNPIKE